jgi:murein DD-endopeptidase MepM/ murein hydrolase activator NlpD
MKNIISRFSATLITLLLTSAVQAEMGGFGRKSSNNRGDSSRDVVEQRNHLVKVSGLSVAFPEGHNCEPISSPYGSTTRYDGSSRPTDRNSGLHGGIDLSLKQGTPLLSMADGEVITHGEGGRMEGIFIWLRYAPEDTGLPYWVFSKYQHLATLPELSAGERVKTGQVIALSGGTGTTGGHYGMAGYPHLHLSNHYGPSGSYKIGGKFSSQVKGEGARSDDPLMIYLTEFQTLTEMRQRPESTQTIYPAIMHADGTILSQGSKIIWPVACR